MTTATQVRERRLPFTGEMMAAALADRKNQTRRVIVPQPSFCAHHAMVHPADGSVEFHGRGGAEVGGRCPYGIPGDRLRGIGTWAVHPAFDPLKPKDIACDAVAGEFWFSGQDGTTEKPGWCGKSRPGRFAPKHLWPLFPLFENTGVRVERVQDISEEDAIAEGFGWHYCGPGENNPGTPTQAFFDMWNSIQSKRWARVEANPWLWVVSFKRIEGGVTA